MKYQHEKSMFRIAQKLSSISCVVWRADHGCFCSQSHNNDEGLSLLISGCRPDFVVLSKQCKYVINVTSGSLLRGKRLLRQLRAFSKAEYKIILVVSEDELRYCAEALDLADCPSIYAIVTLDQFRANARTLLV